MSTTENEIKAEIENYINEGMLPDFDFHINTFGFHDPDTDQEDMTGYDIVITSMNEFLNPEWLQNKHSKNGKYTPVALNVLSILDSILRRFLTPGTVSGQAFYCIHAENESIKNWS